MKKRNWRKYYGYKPRGLTCAAQTLSVSLAQIVGERRHGSYDRYITPADAAYIKWLAKERKTTRRDAYDYAISEPRGRIVSQSTSFLDMKPAAVSGGKKWKANYIWYKPTPFRAKTLGERDYREQVRRYRSFAEGDNPDFRRAA